MQRYNAIVRLRGDVTQETPRFNITAAEIALLKHVHGEDGVRDVIKRSGLGAPVDLEDLKSFLRHRYGERPFEQCFGIGESVRLPLAADGKGYSTTGEAQSATVAAQLASLQAEVNRLRAGMPHDPTAATEDPAEAAEAEALAVEAEEEDVAVEVAPFDDEPEEQPKTTKFARHKKA